MLPGIILMVASAGLAAAITSTTTSSPSVLPQSLCVSFNPCLNGGTCREPDDWECSSDPGMGDTVCDCLPSFRGARCEIKVQGNCGTLTCKTGESCVLVDSVSMVFKCVNDADTRDMTAPYCKVGPHPLNYTVDMGDRDKAAVCLDMYYTDTSSLCHDNDSSIEYDIASEDVAGFFCLKVDYTNWQTCLSINKTFNRANFPQKPVMDVTLEAKENDRFSRKATITFQITFNTPPSTIINAKNYIINMATSGGYAMLDIPSDFSITDDDTVVFSLAESHPRLTIDGATGSLSVQLVDRDVIFTTVKITDDGIPSLSTEVQVNIEVLSLNCSVQNSVYVNVDDVGSDRQVGRIQCTHSRGYTPTFTYISQTGLGLDISAGSGLISVRTGAVADYSVQVNATLGGKLHVDVSFNLIIREIRTCVFTLLNETWNPSFSNPDAPISVSLMNNVERQINIVVGSFQSVTSKVLLFRQGSVIVYFLLMANTASNLDAASNLLTSTVATGMLGNLAVRSYQSYRQVGLVQAGQVNYSSSSPINSVIETRNNTQVTLTCEGLFLLPVGRVTVTWLMTSRNAPVVPLPNSRLQTLTSNPSPGIYQSDLTLNNILYKDTGPFTCMLSDEGGRSDSSSLNIQVIAPPLVSLTPLGQAYISASETIILMCNVTEPKTTTTTIHWFKNDVELTGNAGSGLTSTLSVTGEQQGPTRYHCRAQNVAGMGGESNDITVTLTQASTCAGEDMWPPSAAGFKVNAPCPIGETGVQTRQCGDNGVWQDVETSQCVSNDIGDVINDIQWISEGVQVSPLEDVAKTLGNSTEPRGLGGAEVALVSASLDRLLTIAKESNISDDQSDTGGFAQGFVTTASNLLDPETSEAWDNHDERPTNVLNLIDSLTEVSSDSLTEGQQSTIRSDNIEVLVGKSDPRDIRGIVYPEASERSNDASLNSFLNLSAEAVARIAGFEVLPYSTVYYKNITTQLPQGMPTNTSENATLDVNSDTLALNLFTANPNHLSPPLILNFTHSDTSFRSENRVCAYLNIATDEWESEGCNVTEKGVHYTVCSCDHLTNFAILMNPVAQTVAPVALSIITIIGCSISIFCLVLSVIIYVTIWRYVKSDQAVLIMNICVTLTIAMAVFVVGVDKTSNQDLCTAIAVLLHYFYLVTFFLMLAAGLEIVWTIVQIFATRSKIKPLLVGAWILPLVIVGLSMAGTQMKGYGTPNYCWLSTEGGLIWAFVGPVLIIVIINFVLMGKLVHTLLSTRVMLDKDTAVKVKKALRGICILVPILGVSWVFGILAVNEDVIVFQYIFAILNSLQGLFIFITQVLLSRKVKNGLASYKRRFMSGRDLSSEQHRQHAQRSIPLNAAGESSAYQNLLQSGTSENQQRGQSIIGYREASGVYHDIREESVAVDPPNLDTYDRVKKDNKRSRVYADLTSQGRYYGQAEYVNQRDVKDRESGNTQRIPSLPPKQRQNNDASSPYANLPRGKTSNRPEPIGREDLPSKRNEDYVPYSNRAVTSTQSRHPPIPQPRVEFVGDWETLPPIPTSRR